ncbi:transcription initiation factor tfiid 55 kda subunit [Moniliophthora roreri]|nr:transcription initiation factor tfiid 55 kda subunit [Moniliophthora roreri]
MHHLVLPLCKICKIASISLLLVVASFIAGTFSLQSCRYACSDLDGAIIVLRDTDEYLHCVYTFERNDHVYAVCYYEL